MLHVGFEQYTLPNQQSHIKHTVPKHTTHLQHVHTTPYKWSTHLNVKKHHGIPRGSGGAN